MDQLAANGLKLGIAQRFFLADQDGDFVGQLASTSNGEAYRFNNVVEMHEALPTRGIAGEHPACEPALVNALDLVGQRNRFALIRVHAGDSQDDGADAAMVSMNYFFRTHFGLRVIPLRLQRPIFVDPLARIAGRMHQHRT